MKRAPKLPNTTTVRSKEDINRIHTMLRVIIAHIENKTQIISGGSAEVKEESLDDVLSGLTKITALISKLIPIEKEMEEDAKHLKDENALESAIDWEVLERYFSKKRSAAMESQPAHAAHLGEMLQGRADGVEAKKEKADDHGNA